VMIFVCVPDCFVDEIHSFSFLGGAKPLAVRARLHIVHSHGQNKKEAAAGHDNRSRREDEIGGSVFVMCI
jgi:hypothetical protein